MLYTADSLPEEVVEDFATEHQGFMSYDYLAVTLDDEQAVTTALRDLGYDPVRDDDLIAVLDTEDRSAVAAWHSRRVRS